MAKANAVGLPSIKCTVALEDGDAVEYRTNPLAMYRAEKAYGTSILTGLGDGTYGAMAAICYAVTGGANAAFVRSHDGDHRRALEAWLAMEPAFSVHFGAEVDDPKADGESAS